MRFNVRHVTRFVYDPPVSESIMEVRMQPRSDGLQRCLQFALDTTPPARPMHYVDPEGNAVHHFNLPARHAKMTVTATALVECAPAPPLPHRIGPGAWAELDQLTASGVFWDYLSPSAFVRTTPALAAFAADIGLHRGNDPLVLARRLMGDTYTRFEYSPHSTRVDSPIDEALQARRGVCQDFAHIFLALVRPLGLPARYVSGYLYRETGSSDRSSDGATHAWVEVFLPALGWVGFDPTNNLLAAERHIRVAVGRDYADVPPTRGVYTGSSAARTELGVSVRVSLAPLPPAADVLSFTSWAARDTTPADDPAAQQQQ
jgi:transglutaminase-like putative cysteine protease